MRFNPDDIKIIELDLTTMCNAQCPLCFRQQKNFPEKYKQPFYRPAEEINAQIDKFKHLQWVYFIGQMSEPTTHPDFLSIVSHSKTLNHKVKICTNGQLHDNDYWRKLGSILSNDDEVWFGICGSTNEIHSKYRRNTSLEIILEHAEALREVKRCDCIKVIRFEYNHVDLSSQAFADISSKFHKVEIVDTSIPNEVDNPEFYPMCGVYESYKKLNDVAEYFQRVKPTNVCQSMFDHQLQINPFGEIFPCYRFFENNSDILDWNYDKITSAKYPCCKFCNKFVLDYINKNNLNDII